MRISSFIYRSFFHYWRSNLLVICGAAISAMVLTGTLIVGDSMRFSLEQSAELRLGKIDYAFSGIDRYFRTDIAEALREELKTNVSVLLIQRGIASSQGGEFKMSNIQVLGIDRPFFTFSNSPEDVGFPMDNEAFISKNLANRLQLKKDDSFLVRLEKGSLIPKNAPFVADADNYVSLRLKVGKVLSDDEFGRFNLNISQTAPFNVFISNKFLNEKLNWNGKGNTLLFSEGKSEHEISQALHNHWEIGDLALTISRINQDQAFGITSQRVFIDSISADKIKQVFPGAREILTYMANSMSVHEKSTPYSFIAAGPFSASLATDEILINSWMAEDLEASVGDTVEATYFSIGPLRKLIEQKHSFIVKDIVQIKGQFAERKLMPDLPGLSDAGSCREWDAGVPISLDAIRDKDEDYWNKYRGTPKAFISYDTGKELWQNRFGVCTAIRLPSAISNQEEIERRISEALSPTDLGFMLNAVKEEGFRAARGGVDFSQLFMGLSFFLLAASVILMSLLFNLHLENRIGEMGTLKAVGFTTSLIRKFFLVEGLLIAIPGIFLGLVLAVLYNRLVFLALNTIWQKIVYTSVLLESIQLATLVQGGIISAIIIGLSIWRNTAKRLKSPSSELQRKLSRPTPRRLVKLYRTGGWAFQAMAAGLLAYDLTDSNYMNTGIYFSAGSVMLFGALLLIASGTGNATQRAFNTISLLLRSISRNRARSLRIIILFALGTFITISTGLNKKDPYKNSTRLSGGTGGFQLYMETTLPVLHDLNDPAIQQDLGMNRPLKFIQIRKSEGDDASCLNLNRITSPRILGIPSEQLTDRFSFTAQTDDLNEEKPWQSLKRKLQGDVIPAFLDQTVIQWGLGKKVGDTLVYTNEYGKNMYLKIVGGLGNSIFQGSVLIDEQHFLRHFPSNSGSHVFLIDVAQDQINGNEEILTRSFRNVGMELERTADRLAKFNQVENTYLSIFLLLGGLALILGTAGLGISLARNLMDRGRELGIFRAMGFQRKRILFMIITEHLSLLVIGTLTGMISALTATLPSFLTGMDQSSWYTAFLLVFAILINGFVWIWLISRNSLKKNLQTALGSE
ncbi:MAG: FtsX-like permease family protein [Cytophagales bacterium]|nr:FtsX-like permease family protein [Cytophagales bacterium]